MKCIKCGAQFWAPPERNYELCYTCEILNACKPKTRECWDGEKMMVLWNENKKDGCIHYRDYWDINPEVDIVETAAGIHEWLSVRESSKRSGCLYLPSMIREKHGLYKHIIKPGVKIK